MAKLLVPQGEAKQALERCVKAGNDLYNAKADVAERTARFVDWLELFATWREETIAELNRLYDGRDIAEEFEFATRVSEGSSPRYAFPNVKRELEYAIHRLKSLSDGLILAVEAARDATAIDSLHPAIYAGCRKLYESNDYGEAVEKGFKIVRDRLRSLTTYETGSEAFGKAKLYVDGAAAAHVDDDFQNGVKFLTMAIDRFRNEKSHTVVGNISDPIRAYEYLRLSSLAMHLLDSARA
jgi:uncharacterized protein (TIGR02391 family)